jgi:hypothetical protein
VSNLILILVALTVLACILGLSLAALGLLMPALMPNKTQIARDYLRPNAFWMGLVHGLALLFLLSKADHRPLVGLLAVTWLIFALLCLALGLAAWVQHVGFLLWPEQPKGRRSLGSAAVMAWACAFPYVGQILGIGLLLAAYGAGLAGWTKKRSAGDAPV